VEPPLFWVPLPVLMLLVPEPMVLGVVELLSMGVVEPVGVLSALDGVDGLLMGAGVTGVVAASSVFLPQAPKVSKAPRASTVKAAGLNLKAYMSVSFGLLWVGEMPAKKTI
jgi:hypothetical protein